MNAFNLFTLPQTFALDLDALERKYLELSQQYHPDLIPPGNTREKLEATLKTADLNEAYDILKNPLKRGYHLLNILDPNLKADQEQTIKDPTLLREAMEDREALENTSTLDMIEDIIEQTKFKKERTYRIIQQAFGTQNLKEAQLALYRYRYYDKVLTDATKKLHSYAPSA